MNFTGKMFLFLFLLPTICFTCKCLGVKNDLGLGSSCVNEKDCYVDKRICRDEGYEVFDSESVNPAIKSYMGYSYDFCLRDEDKQHKTKFCECLEDKVNGDGDRGGCTSGRKWCYVNKAACRPFEMNTHKSFSEYIGDTEVIGITSDICHQRMRQRCEASNLYDFDSTALIFGKEMADDCRYEGINDLVKGGGDFYTSKRMYKITKEMKRKDECRCLFDTKCYVENYASDKAVPYCIVDKAICGRERFLVTPLTSSSKDKIKDFSANLKDYGLSQHFCQRKINRHKLHDVEIILENITWKIVDTVPKGHTTTTKEILETRESVRQQHVKQSTTTHTESSGKEWNYHWKVNLNAEVKVEGTGVGAGAEGGAVYNNFSNRSKVETSMTSHMKEYSKTTLTRSELTKEWKATDVGLVVYELRYYGKTSTGSHEIYLPIPKTLWSCDEIGQRGCVPPSRDFALSILRDRGILPNLEIHE